MAIAEPHQTNSNGSDPPISVISRVVAQGHEIVSGTQSYPSPGSTSLIPSHQTKTTAETTSIPKSPIISGQVSIQQPKLTGPASGRGENLQEASPLPEKVGEIGEFRNLKRLRSCEIKLGFRLTQVTSHQRSRHDLPIWSLETAYHRLSLPLSYLILLKPCVPCVPCQPGAQRFPIRTTGIARLDRANPVKESRRSQCF
jgi:hypothetical protein